MISLWWMFSSLISHIWIWVNSCIFNWYFRLWIFSCISNNTWISFNGFIIHLWHIILLLSQTAIFVSFLFNFILCKSCVLCESCRIWIRKSCSILNWKSSCICGNCILSLFLLFFFLLLFFFVGLCQGFH